jgi:peroxiredoxin
VVPEECVVKKLFIIFAILFSFGIVSCTKSDTVMEKSSSSETGSVAPDFVLKDINGNDIKLSQYRGKMVVLEFWATWCPPCKATIPELVSVQSKYAGKGLVVLGVSIDEGDDLQPKLSAFSKRYKINYPILLATEKVSQDYNVMSIPSTFLIGKDQRIISVYRGYVDTLETLISRHMVKTI